MLIAAQLLAPLSMTTETREFLRNRETVHNVNKHGRSGNRRGFYAARLLRSSRAKRNRRWTQLNSSALLFRAPRRVRNFIARCRRWHVKASRFYGVRFIETHLSSGRRFPRFFSPRRMPESRPPRGLAYVRKRASPALSHRSLRLAGKSACFPPGGTWRDMHVCAL